MQVTTKQAADILGKSEDEVLFLVQDKRLNVSAVEDKEINYLPDGRIEFVAGRQDPVWMFEFNDVIQVKKEIEESLDGELQQLLAE